MNEKVKNGLSFLSRMGVVRRESNNENEEEDEEDKEVSFNEGKETKDTKSGKCERAETVHKFQSPPIHKPIFFQACLIAKRLLSQQL